MKISRNTYNERRASATRFKAQSDRMLTLAARHSAPMRLPWMNIGDRIRAFMCGRNLCYKMHPPDAIIDACDQR